MKEEQATHVKRRALVVDDSRTTRRLIAKLLRKLEFAVDEAEDGCRGLQKLANTSGVGLVVVDWNMPEMNGLAFVHRVRSEGSFENVKIMMVTTEIEMSRVAQALAAGADEYLMKPFTAEMLLEKLALMGMRAERS